jgi:hypothetical protein
MSQPEAAPLHAIHALALRQNLRVELALNRAGAQRDAGNHLWLQDVDARVDEVAAFHRLAAVGSALLLFGWLKERLHAPILGDGNHAIRVRAVHAVQGQGDRRAVFEMLAHDCADVEVGEDVAV